MTSETQQQSEWTCKRLLDWTNDYLTQAEVDSPRLSAEMLLAHVLGCQRIDLYVRFDHCPNDVQRNTFKQLVRRCYDHEPVSYLTGKASFYNLELNVSPAVLIPRPETELLVVAGLDYLKRCASERPEVLDLCCGSGCIALALASNTKNISVLASDISQEALDITQTNITVHDLGDKVKLLQSDLFAQVPSLPGFDLIVSNPPYISQAEFARLDAVVRDYEPQAALLAGADGLDYLRPIINQAKEYLKPGGALMLEFAYHQGKEVVALLRECGYLTDVCLQKDHQGHDRLVTAQKQ